MDDLITQVWNGLVKRAISPAAQAAESLAKSFAHPAAGAFESAAKATALVFTQHDRNLPFIPPEFIHPA